MRLAHLPGTADALHREKERIAPVHTVESINYAHEPYNQTTTQVTAHLMHHIFEQGAQVREFAGVYRTSSPHATRRVIAYSLMINLLSYSITAIYR